jgi:hypothetical protein
MNRLIVAALFTLCLCPSLSSAVDIKNIRPCYGPLGATRFDKKCLPGDVFFMTYDLENLALDKTGKASYTTTLELLDAQQKVLFKKETPNDVVPQLGGTRMPGDLHVIMGTKQAAGKYAIKLTVYDKLGKDGKAFTYNFEVVPEAFGFVGASAKAVEFQGTQYVAGFGLVNLTLDAKKQPNVEVKIQILDDSGKAVAPVVQILIPRDMPADTELEKANFVPITFPIFLNRPGRYTIDVQAEDKIAKKTAKLSFPLTVIDVASVTSK